MVGATLFLQACGLSPLSPEEVVETFSKEVAELFEQRKRRKLADFIADDYLDKNKRSKQDLTALAQSYMLRDKSIFSYTNPTSVQKNEDGTISARILTALAAQPITDLSLLPSIKSDIYWFDIKIASRDKSWKLVEASWQQAMLEDFF